MIPPLDLQHGPEILFLPSLIGKPGITPCLLDAPVTQQRLETLQSHAGIEKLCGKGVAESMQGIPPAS